MAGNGGLFWVKGDDGKKNFKRQHWDRWLPAGVFVFWQFNLKTAVGLNREPREIREKKKAKAKVLQADSLHPSGEGFNFSKSLPVRVVRVVRGCNCGI